jgi:hypothetical protein
VEQLAIESRHGRPLGAHQPDGATEDPIEDSGEIGRGLGNEPEDVRGGGLLLPCLSQLAIARLELFEGLRQALLKVGHYRAFACARLRCTRTLGFIVHSRRPYTPARRPLLASQRVAIDDQPNAAVIEKRGCRVSAARSGTVRRLPGGDYRLALSGTRAIP